MEAAINKKRGRPLGYSLSSESKEKIRYSRIGKYHTKETMNKISMSLIRYFKNRNTISDGMENEYKRFSKEATDWIIDHRDILNDTEDVLTNRRISYLNQSEINYGGDIEEFCHYATPEFLLLLKEQLMINNNKEELEEFVTLLL